MKTYRTLYTESYVLIEEWLNDCASEGFYLTHFTQSEDANALHYFLIVERTL